ncbi:DUF2993 domain-containing protein [bacterium]|nr:MAG: DUF2993 domain-containing protein [bacterium]
MAGFFFACPINCSSRSYNFYRARSGAVRPTIVMRATSISSRAVVTLLLGTAILSPAFQAKAAPGDKPDAQGQKVVKRVEQLLRATIKNQDGSPLAISLTPTSKAAQGFLSDVRISGGATQLKSLFVSEFQLHAQNVQVDVPSLWSEGKVRTKRAQTQLRVVITEQDLTRMLANSKSTKDMDLKVKYVGDKMHITGKLNYAIVNGPVSGYARLRQTSDHNVYLDILSLQLRGIEAPGFIKNQLSSRINPVIKYSSVPFNPPFRTLKVVGNKAILST